MGPAELVQRLEAARPTWTVGAAAQAAIAVCATAEAEAHVAAVRERWRADTGELAHALAAAGHEVLPTDTVFLMMRTRDASELRTRLLVRTPDPRPRLHVVRVARSRPPVRPAGERSPAAARGRWNMGADIRAWVAGDRWRWRRHARRPPVGCRRGPSTIPSRCRPANDGTGRRRVRDRQQPVAGARRQPHCRIPVWRHRSPGVARAAGVRLRVAGRRARRPRRHGCAGGRRPRSAGRWRRCLRVRLQLHRRHRSFQGGDGLSARSSTSATGSGSAPEATGRPSSASSAERSWVSVNGGASCSGAGTNGRWALRSAISLESNGYAPLRDWREHSFGVVGRGRASAGPLD